MKDSPEQGIVILHGKFIHEQTENYTRVDIFPLDSAEHVVIFDNNNRKLSTLFHYKVKKNAQ